MEPRRTVFASFGNFRKPARIVRAQVDPRNFFQTKRHTIAAKSTGGRLSCMKAHMRVANLPLV